MRKAFTLAEVIITLGIIGVVAAMTLPTLLKATDNSNQPPKKHKQRIEKSIQYDYNFTE